MVTQQARLAMSREEYLAYDLQHEGRHEYVNGEVVAMAGGSFAHNTITLNLGAELRSALKGRCRVAASDQRVWIRETGLYCYPDIVVVCGAPQLEPPRPESLVNPSFLAEVLSPSTEAYDRGAKAAHYRHLASLQAYALVSTDRRHVEVHVRSGATWMLVEAAGAGSILVEPLAARLELAEIYLGVDALAAG